MVINKRIEKLISQNTTLNGTETSEQTDNKKIPQRRSSTLLAHEVIQYQREPYITSGYRDSEKITVRQCLATLFAIHNETFNIWSHLLAALAFLVYSVKQIYNHVIICNPTVYPILCFVFGTCMMFLSSSFAHLFYCMSWKARHACFYIDYATINIFSFAACQSFSFYSRPTSNDTFDWYNCPYVFIGISMLLSFFNLVLSCLSRHRWREYRFLIRTGLHTVKFICDVSPFMARCFVHGSTCNAHSVYLFNRFILCYAISGIVNASRLPERLLPGYCDLFGHSHHIFHVLITMGNFDAFNVMLTDMVERKDVLSASPYPPTFFTTFGLLILLTLVNSVVVVWFVRNWLTAEEEELFTGSKYLVVYKKTSEQVNKSTRKVNENCGCLFKSD